MAHPRLTLVAGRTRNHVLSAKLCRQAPFSGFQIPWKLSLTFNLSSSKHRCPSLFFHPPRPGGTQPLQMAGPSKKGSIKSPKSPKRGRKAKAATAPETKSVVVNSEDYNIRSLERTQLLTQIKGIIDNALVSPAFWACCQLADMNRLQKLATYDRTAIIFFLKSPITLLSQCELLGL